MKKQYDFAFSLGLQCGTTMALRKAGLQFASYPLDWMGSPNVKSAAQMVAEGFPHWLEREDLRLIDVRRGGINKHIYLNVRTGFGFVHDFSSFKTFDENLPVIAAKYERRIAHLKAELTKSKHTLAVCIEVPNRTREKNENLLAARQILQSAYPQAAIDLVYFYVIADTTEPKVDEVGEGITTVGLDYRTFIDGELNHTVSIDGASAWLAANVSVSDPRTDAERRDYRAAWCKQDRERWGSGGIVKVFVRRSLFRLYRKLERYLMREGLVPKERPLWGLWKDDEK